MTIRTTMLNRFLWGVLLLAGAHAAVAAPPPEMTLNVGQQQVYTHTRNLQRVAVADPTVASVTLTSAKSMFIQGKGPGETEIRLWENAKSPQPSMVLRVQINRPISLEQQALGVAGADSLSPQPAGKAIALTGTANSLHDHDLACSPCCRIRPGLSMPAVRISTVMCRSTSR